VASALRSCVEEENHELRPVWMGPFQHYRGGVYASVLLISGVTQPSQADEHFLTYNAIVARSGQKKAHLNIWSHVIPDLAPFHRPSCISGIASGQLGHEELLS
jgi:hypothetical protein